MNSDNTILEKIDRYTRGVMESEELNLFEQEIATDEQLQRKIELSMIVDQMVVAKEALKLKEQMRKDLYKSKPNWGAYLGVALVGVTLVGGAFWAYQHGQEGKNGVGPVSPANDVSVKNKAKETAVVVPAPKAEAGAPQTNLSVPKSVSKVPSLPSQNSNQVLGAKVEQTVLPVEHPHDPKVLVKSEEKKETHASTVVVTNPCAGLLPQVEFSVVSSCKGEETGEVHIHSESAKGGKAPYSFALGDKQSNMSFDKLGTGYYDLWIKDAQNCQVANSQKVFVPEKNCKVPQQYIFNPDYDHSWGIPYDKDKKPTRIIIQEKGGRVFYQSAVNDFQPAEWNGDSNTGLVLSMGLYFLTIEYADRTVDEATIVVTK